MSRDSVSAVCVFFDLFLLNSKADNTKQMSVGSWLPYAEGSLSLVFSWWTFEQILVLHFVVQKSFHKYYGLFLCDLSSVFKKKFTSAWQTVNLKELYCHSLPNSLPNINKTPVLSSSGNNGWLFRRQQRIHDSNLFEYQIFCQ